MDSMYNYSDVVLVPNYSDINSRDSVDLSTRFLDEYFDSPIIPANMVDCISVPLVEKLEKSKYFSIMHRFGENRIENEFNLYSISIGVNEDDYDYLHDIIDCGVVPRYITVDVAHGHHVLVRNMIEFIRANPEFNDTKIIAGNIGTQEAAKDLISWGADALKVGLSMGKSCCTYNATGVGTPMFSVVREISNMSTVPIIADGQIREPGDVVKALVAGATMVMIGSEFAASIESPAKRTLWGYGKHKLLRGSSTLKNRYIEGSVQKLKLNSETYLKIYDRYHQGIRSGLSYLGINNIMNVQKYATDNWRLKG